MAVDRGYGSGAPLTAAQSASRRRRANSANLRQQGGARTAAARERAAFRSGLEQIAARNPVTNFIPGGSSFAAMTAGMRVNRLVSAANSMRPRAAGGETLYEAAMDRARAIEQGQAISRTMAQNNLRSVPNTGMNAGGYSRSTYLPTADAVPARMDAQIIQQRFNTNPGSFYSSGVPAGGWQRSPNLRRNTPVESNYPVSLGGMRVNNSGMSPEVRSSILSSLDEATVARNLSASMKPGGRTYFPRPWQELSRSGSRFDPVSYRLNAYDNFTGKVRRNVK